MSENKSIEILDRPEVNSETENNEKYLLAYFGKNGDFYLEQYHEYVKGQRFTFNVSAFFCGIFWFLYRKMFIHAVVIFAFLIAMDILQYLFSEYFLEDVGVSLPNRAGISYLLMFIYAIIYGLTGNYFYLKKSIRAIKIILSRTTDEDRRIELLTNKGGTSWTPFILLAVLIAYALFSILHLRSL